MKKLNIYLILLLLSGFHLTVNAKNDKSSVQIDQIMQNIPDSFTTSTQNIAYYINIHFKSQKEKARAIFYWIASNIQYDIDNMFPFDINQHATSEKENILQTHKGVCDDYALLFKNIADKVGLRTYIVTGYTKKSGKVDGNPHAWVASLIDSNWYLSDPTWGAGHVEKGVFIKKFDDGYFMVEPERFIKSHIPFDPIWQLSNYLVTKQQFNYNGRIKADKRSFFNFADSINKMESQQRIERLETMRDRIASNGIVNYLDHDHLIHLQSKIIFHYRRKNEINYYSALSNYNEGIYILNEYIAYKNKNYQPIKSIAEIKKILYKAEDNFKASLATLNKIDVASDLDQLKNQLNQSVEKAMNDLRVQKNEFEKLLSLASNSSHDEAPY